MSQNKIILITDEYTRDGYLYHFIKGQQAYMPHITILHVHLGNWSNFRVGMNTAAELHMPLIWKGTADHTMKEKLGHRVTDFLILNGVIDYESTVTFIFNNANLHFIADTIKSRIKKSKVVVYVDVLNWEQREGEDYVKNASLFRSNEEDQTKLKPLRNKEERTFFEKADVLWCYNEACRSFIENVYNIKALYWPYISEDEDIPVLSDEERMTARRRLSLHPGEIVVLFYYDGVLVESFDALMAELNRPPFRLLITGRPALSDTSLLCRTSFLGDVKTFTPFLQIADMVILLSEKEIKSTFPQMSLRMNIPVLSSPLAMAADLFTPDIHLLSEKTADYIRELAVQEEDSEIPSGELISNRNIDQFLQQLVLA
ncbi:glycosyltransferase family protein [Chitinophaga filiformis]|uniref:Uncharacterized protein n=1 Tax=Chitinophaga filiformis TaxID=104663 RepID=A0A1G7LQ67_CHIFI|nr:hypothetical protein [Chitinophaga filiformis]SDF51516.1 hypothetical protein SAMN04488121_102146 [Chitinophaga filiformis]